MTNPPFDIQIRVWDSRRGNSFEEAWLRGWGSFGGSSKVFVLSPPESNLQPPLNLVGLEPFEFGPLATFWVFFPYPTNSIVVEGQSAQFEVGPVGGPMGSADLHTYQWQRETLPNTWTDIAGATSKVLVIPAVQKADAGRYRVVSRFDCASGVSMPSVLMLVEQPRLDAALMSEGNQNLLLSGIGSVQIEVSYDLSHWTNVAAATNGSGRWEVRVTNVSEFPQRFFRARLAP